MYAEALSGPTAHHRRCRGTAFRLEDGSQLIGREGCGKCFRLEEFGHTTINEEARQGHSDNPVGPGIAQRLAKDMIDLYETTGELWIPGNQYRLLIAPCRPLTGMTERGLIGQRR